MQPKRSRLHLYLAPLLAFTLTGCLRSEVLSKPLDREVERLAALNTDLIRLRVASAPSSETVGRQFALIALPLGSISIGDPRLDLEQELFQALALRGYRPVFEQSTSNDPGLEVVLDQVSLSAYDLLFARRLVARVELHGRAVDRNGTIYQAHSSGSAAEFRRFGFVPELTGVYVEALRQGVDHLLSELNIRESR